jgi:predicted short-subunit dehydrogenase-like oxidoreductase (DUF2520 family)
MKRLLIIGQGKVGAALASGARGAGVRVRTMSARAVLVGAPSPRADLVVVASRDGDVVRIASELARRSRLPGAVVHCAGALGPEALAPLAQVGVAVAAAHPLVSFSGARSTSVAGAALVIEGAGGRHHRARAGSRLGCTWCPLVVERLDRAKYHAAAALVANGAAALAAVGARWLSSSGVPAERASAMLGALLASVAANVAALGPARALSGPVRRGDASTIARHLAALSSDPEATALYRSLVQVQLGLTRALTNADEPGVESRSDADISRLLETLDFL